MSYYALIMEGQPIPMLTWTARASVYVCGYDWFSLHVYHECRKVILGEKVNEAIIFYKKAIL